MFTLEFCEKNITEGTIVIGPGAHKYKVTDSRKTGAVREYELTTLSGQWHNWFPFTDIKKIIIEPDK